MTETANDSHERVVAEILDEVFDLDTSGAEAEGGYGSEREAVEFDWNNLTPEELVSKLKQAEKVIDGYASAAQDISPVLLTFMGDAQKRAWGALQIARRALEE